METATAPWAPRRHGRREPRRSSPCPCRRRSGWSRPGLYWESGPRSASARPDDPRPAQHRGRRGRGAARSAPRILVDRRRVAGRPATMRYGSRAQARGVRARRRTDPSPRLAAIDDTYLTMETANGPSSTSWHRHREPERSRSYVLSSTGWYHVNVRPRATGRACACSSGWRRSPGALSRIATGKLERRHPRLERAEVRRPCAKSGFTGMGAAPAAGPAAGSMAPLLREGRIAVMRGIRLACTRAPRFDRQGIAPDRSRRTALPGRRARGVGGERTRLGRQSGPPPCRRHRGFARSAPWATCWTKPGTGPQMVRGE